MIIRWAPQAVDDLEAIQKFIARDSQHYARLVIERLLQAVGLLDQFPDSGRIVPELGRSVAGAHALLDQAEAGAHEITRAPLGGGDHMGLGDELGAQQQGEGVGVDPIGFDLGGRDGFEPGGVGEA